MTLRARPSWQQVATRFLPFADAASEGLSLRRMLRLALFQVSVGMTIVLLNGTLNRVMVVELGVPIWLVALLISLPLVFAPLRALIGHRSDNHRSILGWRRVPYLWFGALLQWAGLALMPFALTLMSRPDVATLGIIASVVAFLLAGAGIHTVQTAGLALLTDLAPKDDRPRAVALQYVMLLVGMMLSALIVASLLTPFTPTRLVQVVQGAALLSLILNGVALWKQEARRSRQEVAAQAPALPLRIVWRQLMDTPGVTRLFAAVALGTIGFSAQDALLEPYGGQALGMSVGGTTALTGLWAVGNLVAFAFAARMLSRGGDCIRLAGMGGVVGLFAFVTVLFAAPIASTALLFVGAAMIGLGGGLFLVGTLSAAMALTKDGNAGLVVGAWGAVQATAAGVAIAAGGIGRDLVATVASQGGLGATLAERTTGYTTIYLAEIVLLLAALIALGPLVGRQINSNFAGRFGLNQFPTG